MKRKVETVLIFTFLILFLVLMFTSSRDVINSVTFSIDIWKNNLFPSLFPFLILSKIFINYGVSDVLSEMAKPFISNRLNISSKCNYIVILSLFSGFPSSSIYLRDAYLKNEINKDALEYLLSFCFFSNPLFVLATVGSLLLGDIKLGVIILISHYLSNFMLAFFTRPKEKLRGSINLRESFSVMKSKVNKSVPIADVIKKSVVESINTLLLLLGIVTIFLVISNLLLDGISEPYQSILNGILEMTGGIKRIGMSNLPMVIRLSLITGFISFGGISIHMQILSILEDIKIKYKRFVCSRILSTIISIIILNLLLLYFY